MRNRIDLSLFFTKRTGAPHGDSLGRMYPLSNKSYICSFNSFISDAAIRHGCMDIGEAPRTK